MRRTIPENHEGCPRFAAEVTPGVWNVHMIGADGWFTGYAGCDLTEADALLLVFGPALLAACETMLGDVSRYLERGGKLTDREAVNVEAMRAAVANFPITE